MMNDRKDQRPPRQGKRVTETSKPDQRFPRRAHLRQRRDFDRVFAQRCSAADDVLVVYVAPNDLTWSRLGISVSRRIGNAPRRNYARRRIREAFRRQKTLLPLGIDIVCVAKNGAANKRKDVAASLRELLARATSRRPSNEASRTPQPTMRKAPPPAE